MATMSSFFTKFLSFLLLLFHLSCFSITPSAADHPHCRKRHLSSLLSKSLKPHKAWTFIKKLFKPSNPQQTQNLSTASPLSSDHSTQIKPAAVESSDVFSGDHDLFPLRNDIFPCTTCGEIFHKAVALDSHRAVKHAVSELHDGDTGRNIVEIIFKTGWNNNNNVSNKKSKTLMIHRIMRIHNSTKTLARFEEYREHVKAKAAMRRSGGGGGGAWFIDERCVADGNELLRFHCSTFLCELGNAGGSSGICGHQYCSVCGVIKSGFSAKLDGISTFSGSFRAHAAIPEEIEEEFGFMNVKRAMLVCRVVAGRVGSDDVEDDDLDGKEGGGFDSVVGRSGCGTQMRVDEEELLVFNPRAVLPCFVIVYTV